MLIKHVVTGNRTNGAEGNDAHDDQRLHIALQGYSKQRVDQNKRQQRAQCQPAQRISTLFLLAAKLYVDIGIALLESRNQRGANRCADFLRGDFAAVYVCRNKHVALAVTAVDGRIAPSDGEICDGVEGHFRAVRGADVHVFKVADRFSLCFREAHHHTNIVLAAGNALGFSAIKSCSYLGRKIIECEA